MEGEMRSRRISLVLGIVFLTAAVARADKVTSDYDHSVNFYKYKTFMWIDEPQSEQPFMQDRIMSAVNAQLASKGLRRVSEGADLAVKANLATEEKHTWETYYNGGPGWGWGWGGCCWDGWGWGTGWATTVERT